MRYIILIAAVLWYPWPNLPDHQETIFNDCLPECLDEYQVSYDMEKHKLRLCVDLCEEVSVM